jgi:hypothetical protein
MGGPGAAATIIQVLAPKDGEKVRHQDLDKIEFRWAAVPGATTYSFVVNDETGELIWRSRVPDTTAALPAKVRASVLPRSRIKWIVQAANVSASSDIFRVEILP